MMQQQLHAVFFLVFAGVLTLWGCIKLPEYPITPHIENIFMTPNIIDENNQSVLIRFDFTDGDGDLGSPNEPEPRPSNIFVQDTRNCVDKVFTLPDVSPQGNTKVISGSISIEVPTEFCRCDWELDYDTVIYEIRIVDQAKHVSNIISTPPLIIRCDSVWADLRNGNCPNNICP